MAKRPGQWLGRFVILGDRSGESRTSRRFGRLPARPASHRHSRLPARRIMCGTGVALDS